MGKIPTSTITNTTNAIKKKQEDKVKHLVNFV